MEHMDFSFEIKEHDDKSRTFAGYAAVFGNVDQGRDLIKQGAFAESLLKWQGKGKLPKLLWQHDPRRVIGTWTELKEDEYGLFGRGKLTEGVQDADEAYALLKDGAVEGLSIGYKTTEDEWDPDTQVRKLIKLDIMEASIVTFAMNESASVTAVKNFRQELEACQTISDAEKFLREAGHSRKESRDFLHCVKSIVQREAGNDSMNNLLQSMQGINSNLK